MIIALEIFKLVGSVFVDTDETNEKLEKTDDNAKKVGSSFVDNVGKAAKFGAGVVAGVGAGAAALYGVASKAAETADEIDKMSAKIGISKESYQEWSYVLGQNGMDINMLQTGMKTLVSKMDSASEGTESAVDMFDKLGVSIYDANGNIKDQETMLNEAMYALADMENGTEKARLATELFGKSGVEMMPMLNGGAEGMKELTERSHELGLVMSDEAVNAGVVLGDTMDDVKDTFGAVITKIGVELMPVIQGALDFVLAHMPEIQAVFETVFGAIEIVVTTAIGIVTDLFGGMGGSFDGVVQGLQDTWDATGQPLFDALKPVLQALFDNFDTIWSGISSLFETAWDMLATVWNTIGQPIFDLIVDVIGIVSDVFAEYMPEISEIFKDMCDTISQVWNDNLKPVFDVIGNLIENVLAPIFKKVFKTYITEYVKTAFDTISSLWNNSLKPIFTGITEFIGGVFTGNWKKAFKGISDIVGGIFGGMITLVKTPINSMLGFIEGFANGCIRGINKVIGALNSFKIDVPDWVTDLTGVKDFGFNLNTLAEVDIPQLADGGIVDQGQLFVAREAGAELVGQANGKTTVMNNDQIIEAVSNGVYDAFLNAFTDSQNGLRRVIADALDGANIQAVISDAALFNSVQSSAIRHKKRTNTAPFPV